MVPQVAVLPARKTGPKQKAHEEVADEANSAGTTAERSMPRLVAQRGALDQSRAHRRTNQQAEQRIGRAEEQPVASNRRRQYPGRSKNVAAPIRCVQPQRLDLRAQSRERFRMPPPHENLSCNLRLHGSILRRRSTILQV